MNKILVLTLPSLSQFSGSKEQDGDAFDRWVRKLSKYAELESWTDRQKPLQLELRLVGRAEQTYELLPSESRDTFIKAVESLRKRLHPVQNEALLSAQLIVVVSLTHLCCLNLIMQFLIRQICRLKLL